MTLQGRIEGKPDVTRFYETLARLLEEQGDIRVRVTVREGKNSGADGREHTTKEDLRP